MENKKILIFYSIFNMGGAERSILKLIKKLLDENFYVDVLLVTKGGKMEPYIDSRANILYLRSKNFGTKFKQAKGISKLLEIADLFGYALMRLEQLYKSFLFKFKKYQAVFIGLHGLSPRFCLKNVKALKYIQFIRSDLKYCDVNKKSYNQINNYYEEIDHYVCVSQTSLDSFIEIFPSLKEKAIRIYNLLESNKIIERSKISSSIEMNNDSFNILSVCRLQDKSKGLFRMADVLNKLLDKGYDIRWYVIGEGEDRQALNNYLDENVLTDRMILLGKKDNPYPYFMVSDLVAVLSYYEGLCGVVNEAKILERPLISTEFSGIHEQITNGFNGLVVKNEEEAIIIGLEKLLDNKAFLKKLAVNEMPQAISNDKSKIDQLINLIYS